VLQHERTTDTRACVREPDPSIDQVRSDRIVRFSSAEGRAPRQAHGTRYTSTVLLSDLQVLPASAHRKVYTTAVTTYITPLITPEKVRCASPPPAPPPPPKFRESPRPEFARVSLLAPRVSKGSRGPASATDVRARASVGFRARVCHTAGRRGALLACVQWYGMGGRDTRACCVRMCACARLRVSGYTRGPARVCVRACALAGGMCVGGA